MAESATIPGRKCRRLPPRPPGSASGGRAKRPRRPRTAASRLAKPIARGLRFSVKNKVGAPVPDTIVKGGHHADTTRVVTAKITSWALMLFSVLGKRGFRCWVDFVRVLP